MNLNITKDIIDNLVELQEIETQCDAIEKKLHELPQQLEALDLKLELFHKTIDAETLRINELEKMYRTHEAEAQDFQSKVKKSQAKLSAAKTNKEYKSSLKEIEDLQRGQAKTEDSMLECLELADAVKKQIQEKKAEYAQLQRRVEEEKELLNNESEINRKKFEETDKIRSKVVERIPAELLARYNQLKTRRGGAALAGVKDAICRGCNVNIPPQLFNELQRFDRLRHCPHCERIIYPIFENPHEGD